MGLYGELWVWGMMRNDGELRGITGNLGELWGFLGLHGE